MLNSFLTADLGESDPNGTDDCPWEEEKIHQIRVKFAVEISKLNGPCDWPHQCCHYKVVTIREERQKEGEGG